MGFRGLNPMGIGNVIPGFGNQPLKGMLGMAALDQMGDGQSKDNHVEEITVDDLMTSLIDALDNDKDVFDYEKEVTSDPWFKKQGFGGLKNSFSFVDPWMFINQIYGSPFGLSNAQSTYGRAYGMPQQRFSQPQLHVGMGGPMGGLGGQGQMGGMGPMGGMGGMGQQMQPWAHPPPPQHPWGPPPPPPPQQPQPWGPPPQQQGDVNFHHHIPVPPGTQPPPPPPPAQPGLPPPPSGMGLPPPPPPPTQPGLPPPPPGMGGLPPPPGMGGMSGMGLPGMGGMSGMGLPGMGGMGGMGLPSPW